MYLFQLHTLSSESLCVSAFAGSSHLKLFFHACNHPLSNYSILYSSWHFLLNEIVSLFLTFHYLQHENLGIMRNGVNESTFFPSFISHVKQQKHRTCKVMKTKPVIEQAYAYRSFDIIYASLVACHIVSVLDKDYGDWPQLIPLFLGDSFTPMGQKWCVSTHCTAFNDFPWCSQLY